MNLMQKIQLTLFAILFLALVFLVARKEAQPQAIHPIVIRSISETQQQLKDVGLYQGRIDGIWGPETERAYCNWMAAQSWPKEK